MVMLTSPRTCKHCIKTLIWMFSIHKHMVIIVLLLMYLHLMLCLPTSYLSFLHHISHYNNLEPQTLVYLLLSPLYTGIPDSITALAPLGNNADSPPKTKICFKWIFWTICKWQHKQDVEYGMYVLHRMPLTISVKLSNVVNRKEI